MKKSIWKKAAAAAAAASVLCTGAAGVMTVSAEESGSDGMVRSFLTGKLVPESIGRTKAISVMFNNIQAALPQSGISNAEIVYESPVEGGITRLMGILEDYQDVERIGSVRSCRNYYVYFAREFNTYYLHFGQSVYALDLLNLPSTLNLSGLDSVGETVYYRSDDFESPHNVFTDYDRIWAGIDEMDYPETYSDEYLSGNGHYQFAADDERITLDNGTDAIVAAPGYAYNNGHFVYDAETGKYTRYQYGDVQIDYLTGEALTYDNIIFQNCSWEKFDENGYLNIDVLSGGEGTYITNGKAIDITWKKDEVNTEDPFANENFGVTHYYDADGNEITLNQGKTWVCIVLNSENAGVYPDLDSYTPLE